MTKHMVTVEGQHDAMTCDAPILHLQEQEHHRLMMYQIFHQLEVQGLKRSASSMSIQTSFWN